MDLQLKDMYIVDTGSGETHQFGPYPIVQGFYGPVPLSMAQRFQGIGGGQRVRVASAQEMLLLFGVLKPEKEGDFLIIEDWIARLEGYLGKERMKIIFDDAAPESEADKAEEEGVQDEEELGTKEGAMPLPVLPENFEADFPGYHKARNEMLEAGFDFAGLYDLKKMPSKPELMRAYLGYLTEIA